MPLIKSVLTMNSAIDLPVHHVLYPSSLMARVQETIVCQYRASTNELRTWSGRCWGNQRTISDRFDSGNMKCRMDPHSGGKLKTDHLRVDNLCDGQRLDEPGV